MQDENRTLGTGEMGPVYRRRASTAEKKPPRKSIVVSRPILRQDIFDNSQQFAEYGKPTSPSEKLRRALRRKVQSALHWQPNIVRLFLHFFVHTFPVLKWVPKYNVRGYLLKDCIAGLTVGIMNIPQGMAYGLLASMPAVFGLYTSFFPVLIYTVMCTSRHVSVGVFAIISIMTSKVVQRYALSAPNSDLVRSLTDNLTQLQTTEVTNPGDVHLNLDVRITVVVALTVTVGIWQVLMGILGLGYLTVYLSDQLVKGFTAGAAFHVFTSQLRSVFGIRGLKEYSGALKLVYTYIDFFSMIKHTHVPTLVISIVCLVFLLVAKYAVNENPAVQRRLPIKIPLPAELLVVIFGAAISYLVGLGPKYGVNTVGDIPLGMPVPKIPDLSILPAFALDSFAIAIVSFAITLSLAKLYATKYKYRIDSNQELRALGFSNIFGGFFQCIPSTGSLGRTAVQTSVGGETQLVSVISAIFVMVVLLALGHLVEPLPKACLGCIILVSLIGMLKQVSEIGTLWKISAVDTSVFVVSLVAVLLLDVDLGLGVAVGWSLLTVVFRTQRPDVSVLGRALHTEIYKRVDVYKSAAEVPGCKIIRFDAPLYYANAEFFLSRAMDLAKLGKKYRHYKHSFEPLRSSVSSESHFAARDSTGLVNPGLVLERNAESMEMGSVSRASVSEPPSTQINFSPSKAEGGKGTKDAATLTVDFAEVPISHLIVDCSSMCFVDVNGVAAVKELAAECDDAGVTLFLASCKANMREFLSLCGFSPHLSVDHIFVAIHDAVMQSIKEHAEASRAAGVPYEIDDSGEEDTDDVFVSPKQKLVPSTSASSRRNSRQALQRWISEPGDRHQDVELLSSTPLAHHITRGTDP